MSVKNEHQVIELLERMIHEQKETNRLLRQLNLTDDEVLAILQGSSIFYPVVDFRLLQLGASSMITGTVPGTTSTFNIIFVPATNFIPLTSGPTVSVDDPQVTLTPVDSSNNFTAAVAAGDTGASYNLTVTGVNNLGATITHSFNVPILPVPPPPPTPVTDFSLNQTS